VKFKRIDDCVLCFVANAVSLSTFSSSSSMLCERLGHAITLLSDRYNSLLCIFSFSFFFFLPAGGIAHCGANVFIECFNHFHGGRILYLCSCTILFFLQESVMYEINQSHMFENKSLF